MLEEPQFLKHFSFAGDCRHRSEAYATCAGGDTIRCLHTHTSHAPSHTYRIIKMFETTSFPSICTASSTKRRRAVGRHVPDPQVRAFSPLRVHECPRKGLFCATWFPASRLYEACAKRRLSDDTITRLPPVLTQVPANEIEQRNQAFPLLAHHAPHARLKAHHKRASAYDIAILLSFISYESKKLRPSSVTRRSVWGYSKVLVESTLASR